MTRSNSRYLRHMAQKELHQFLQERALCWAARGKYALSADYVIRALNHRARHPLNLVIGCIAGTRTQQPEFVKRCKEGLQRVMQRRACGSSKDAPGLFDLPEVQPHRDLLMELWTECELPPPTPSLTEETTGAMGRRQDVAARHDLGDQPPNRIAEDGVLEEVLHIREHEPHTTTAATALRAGSAVSREPLAELLEPKHSTSGRGLYARQKIKPGTTLLMDEPVLAMRMNEECCAHCLKRMDKCPSSHGAIAGGEDPGGVGVPCPYCRHETYCSTSCRDLAWRNYHACLCSHVNPAYGAWEAAMREQLIEGGGEAGSDGRAVLTCLAIGKICGMATVKQAHPLSLPGIAGLRGTATYEASAALGQVGAMAVAIADALRQTHLYMEEIISLFGIIQTNEFLLGSSGIAIYPVLSLLNHSCEPNCAVVGPSRSSATQADTKQLVTTSGIRDGEQLTIDYNTNMTSRLRYEERKLLFAQRHFECFCPKCVLRS